MNKPKNIVFFQNGNMAVFDVNGEQIVELQKYNTIIEYLKFIKKKGVNIFKNDIIIKLCSSERTAYIKPFKTNTGIKTQDDGNNS